MAQKTKIRATQISASMPTDTAAAAAASGLVVSHLSGTLAHIASAIKRVHGASSFTNSAAGVFGHTLKSDTSNTDALGTSSITWSDLFLGDGAVINLGEDQDITLTHVADTGVEVGGSNANGTNLRLNNSAADGDARVEYQLGGTTVWSMGVEDGDSDKFVIEDGAGALGADPAFEIAADKSAKFFGTLEATTSITIGSAAMSEADLEQLDGITAGTAAASKALVLDASKDIGTIRNLTIDGTFSDGNYTFDTSGNVTGLGSVGSGAITSSGIIKTDDGTEATSTTDGSLQTDGGLSVAKSAVIGDDLDLLSDGAILSIGSTSKFVLTDQGANNAVMAASGARLAFGNAGEYISGDGTDLKVVSSGDVDITATLVDVTGAGAFSGNLTVGGNLDINGTTTTVDSVNLSVKDSIIALGVSGSDGGYSTTGDRGILFPRGTDDSEVAGLYWDGSRFNMTVSKTGPLSGSFGSASGYNKLMLGRVEFDSAADYIRVNTHMELKAAADIILDPGGNNVVPGSDNADALGSSGTAWADLFLGDGAVVNFNAGDVTVTHASNLLTVGGGHLRVDGSNKMQIGGPNDYLQLDTDLKIISSADVVIDPVGGELKVDGNVVPNSDSADSLGASGTAWAKLWVDDISLAGQGRIDLDADGDTSIRSNIDDVIKFEIGGADKIQMTTTVIAPDTDDGMALGKTTNRWSDLFLAEGGVINWDDGDATLTQASDIVTLAGAKLDAQLRYSVNNVANGGVLMTAYDGSAAVADLALDLDGMNDIGADLADADLIAVDDGAAGSNRKCAMSRVVTYIQSQLVQKTTLEISAGVASDTDVDLTFETDSDWTDAGSTQKEVYVNGQLMLEGTNAGANKDFYPGGSAGRIKFEFGLEAGDVIQSILRAG